MPGYDGTGPLGAGPGTGRNQGPCGAGRRRRFGRSMGSEAWGFGRGVYDRPRWGRRAFGYGPFGAGSPGSGPASQNEVQSLKEEQASLQNELEAIQRRLAELETA
ncbi:MAG: DUF5320 domain-containing protein [Syntrophobacterales bacterium]|jgi:hypothetical protein|nr:DUF5320 domain-containing protein [Syntrophobacterales bacterium]